MMMGTMSYRLTTHFAGFMRPGRQIACVFAGAAILLLGGCQLADMARFSYANSTAAHHWADEARTTTVRFEMLDDHIVVPVSVNRSKPLNFVVDSGAAATVILESQDTKLLALTLGAELPVSGVGAGPDPTAYIVADTAIAVGSVRLEGLSVIYLPVESVPFFDNVDEVYFDGVIGASFFERFVVEIDYDQQLISFSEPAPERYRAVQGDSGWLELPLQIESGLPYLTTEISVYSGQPVTVKLLIDTGYRGPVSLTPDTHEGIAEPIEYFSMISQGLSGDVATMVGMSRSLSVGGFKLNNIPVSYSIIGGESDNDSNGLLGNEVLSHFNLMFDYANKRMFVSRNENFNEPVNADRSGLLLRPYTSGAVVKSVASGSAAEASGLRVGDTVSSIDDQVVTRSNLGGLKRLLASGRETVSLCWLSSGQEQCGKLELASRFKQSEQ
tara:strand:- start:106347 stop:107672 length:1326 start_codon:yes stop_codon:yes gene_type:complete